MAIDLSGLNVAELEKLIVDAKARIEVVKKQQFAELRRTLEAQARDAGFDIYELFAGGARAPRAAGGDKKAVAPKYRNPENASQTWTGRGKQPVWVRDAIAAGKSLESMAI
ncbi:MAG: H-NS histone family protein [Rhodanobacteraceae bacterium]|jgi:DNA-binding protein H-NS|nr:H-NS histone family protein [Rhodanobacteraceae bacterium]